MRKVTAFIQILLLAAVMLTSTTSVGVATQSFIDRYPNLQGYVFKEKQSELYLGFGASPLTLLNNRVLFSVTAFQSHWITSLWDIELVSASFGFGLSSNALSNSRQMLLRTVPKFRVSQMLSIGPMLGWEFINFPNAASKLRQGGVETKVTEAFSQRAVIYGFALSENFALNNSYTLKVSQFIYRETYSTSQTYNGWKFWFVDQTLGGDASPIEPGWVFALEFSLIF